MKKKIIYVDFNKKRRINLFHFTFNKIINFFTHKITNTNYEKTYNIDKNKKNFANKIYYL